MNEIIEYDDYAEIILCDQHGNEKARALIDLDDIETVSQYKWCVGGRGYVYNRKIRYLHKLIMDVPEGMVIDHENGNKLDNRKSNLRICTLQENCMNKSKNSNNTSGHPGVGWKKERNKWRAYISINRRLIHLGYFDCIEDAIEARKQAEIDYFGEYRRQE